MSGAARLEDPRIVGEVWPLELIARESDPGAPAAVDALADFGQASPANPGSRRRLTMKLGAEPMETPHFGAIAGVSRSRSTRWSIQAHCQRSYVRVEILKNESLHAQGRAGGRQNDFFDLRLTQFDHFVAATTPARPALLEPAARSSTPTFGEFLVSWRRPE